MSVARYWPVAASAEAVLPFTTAIMEGHLASDWAPEIPELGGRRLMGWPSVMTEECEVGGTRYLGLREYAGRSERQWKSFLSWMAAVCGTREVLLAEGYDWVAPASAFYPERRLPVGTLPPPGGFMATKLVVTSDSNNASRLRPDYVAVRPAPGGWEIAVAESKGIGGSLASMDACPPRWASQVRNVSLRYEERPHQPGRFLVVAVRSAPNAKRTMNRRFQVRAWNESTASDPLPDAAAMEVAMAAITGVCLNLGMQTTVRALAVAHAARSQRDPRVREPLLALLGLHSRAAYGERDQVSQVIPTERAQVAFGLTQEARETIDLLLQPNAEAAAARFREVSRMRRARREIVASRAEGFDETDVGDVWVQVTGRREPDAS